VRLNKSIYRILFILATIVSVGEFILLGKQKRLLYIQEKIRKKLRKTSVRISKANHEDEIYSIALEAIVGLIPNATKGSVLILEEDGNFHYRVVKGFHKELKNFIIKKEKAYLYKINQFRETAIIKNPQEFDRLHADKETVEGLKKIKALDIYSSISAPIYIDNELIGLINIDSDKLNHNFSENDLEITDQIKCELELAIKNALAQNKLKYLANFDELTGMMNRRTLKLEFEKEVGKNNNRKISLVMIDLDNFKILNDSYGHYFGDRALKHFSEILGDSIRSSDLVARFAGDEFVLMLKDCDYVDATNRMRAIVQKMDMLKLDEIILKFSFGICEFVSNNKVEFDTILGIADAKMYEHKRRKSLLHD
jgi:diguanylate cyclase (GGDEF)-like protein